MGNVHWQVEEHNLPDNLEDMVIKNQTGIDSLNEFAAIFKELGHREVTALSELAAFTKTSVAEELKTLASCMYEFETFPDIHTPEQYGRYIICESGYFEYDDNLDGYIDFQSYNAPLNQAELTKIKETIEGQSSDGFGEGLEQREIKCNGKEIYVSLWNSHDWSLKTAEEMGISEQKHEMKFGGM